MCGRLKMTWRPSLPAPAKRLLQAPLAAERQTKIKWLPFSQSLLTQSDGPGCLGEGHLGTSRFQTKSGSSGSWENRTSIHATCLGKRLEVPDILLPDICGLLTMPKDNATKLQRLHAPTEQPTPWYCLASLGLQTDCKLHSHSAKETWQKLFSGDIRDWHLRSLAATQITSAPLIQHAQGDA